jgi:hypothetical protein
MHDKVASKCINQRVAINKKIITVYGFKMAQYNCYHQRKSQRKIPNQ